MAHLAGYRQAHPLVFVFTHWVNLVCMFGLIITGLLIHFPFIPWVMGIACGVHMVCAFVIIINLVVRIVLSLFVKTAQRGGTRKGLDRDIKNFLPSKANRHQFLAWVKYYLFLKKQHPKGTKYGSPQKLVYFIVPFALAGCAVTGFCLWGPTSTWGLFVWITNLLGGAMNVRIVHYFLMWAFVIFILIHVYLANVEGTGPSRLMFKHQEHPGLVVDPQTGDILGYDNLDGQLLPVDAQGNPPVRMGLAAKAGQGGAQAVEQVVEAARDAAARNLPSRDGCADAGPDGVLD